MNLAVKRIKRCGHGFKRFEHYRLRVLLHAAVLPGRAVLARLASECPLPTETRGALLPPSTDGRPFDSPDGPVLAAAAHELDHKQHDAG